MAVREDYETGTVSIDNGTKILTGVGTAWQLREFSSGDLFLKDSYVGVVDTVDSDTQITLVDDWTGPTLSGAAYRLRYMGDAQRTAGWTRDLIDLLGNGNLQSMAGLSGSNNKLMMFNGPASLVTIDKSELISGVHYDVQVADLAERADYDEQTTGFAALVADVGDGRAAVYSKLSNASADWSNPAYITGAEGDVGPSPTFDIDSVTTLPPGSAAVVTLSPVTGGYEFDFELPEGRRFANQGAYNATLAYDLDDVVTSNGSSFIAVQAVPIGEAPSGAAPPIDTAYWGVLAAKGINGAGTVSAVSEGPGISIDSTDPTNPEISVDATIATTGKAIAMALVF